jgi:hypothetical protein
MRRFSELQLLSDNQLKRRKKGGVWLLVDLIRERTPDGIIIVTASTYTHPDGKDANEVIDTHHQLSENGRSFAFYFNKKKEAKAVEQEIRKEYPTITYL